MAFPTDVLIYAGWGGSLRATVKGRIENAFDEGRRAESGALQWTHKLILPVTSDVRHACTRSSNSLTYADGDEIRLVDSSGPKFVVVLSDVVGKGFQGSVKMALLMLDTPNWTHAYWTTQ